MSAVPTTALIAIGSNLGDRLENLRAGIEGLRSTPGVEVVAISGLYETAPVGGPDRQGAFYNAATRVETRLDAADLLARLHEIEADRERERVVRWGPRTLDLDLLIHGELVSDDPQLEVPHPRMHERRFVLVPVCDIAPDLVHPQFDSSMRELLQAAPAEPGDLALAADDWAAPAGERSP